MSTWKAASLRTRAHSFLCMQRAAPRKGTRACGPIKIVPLLTGSYADYVGERTLPSEAPDVSRMVAALRKAEEAWMSLGGSVAAAALDTCNTATIAAVLQRKNPRIHSSGAVADLLDGHPGMSEQRQVQVRERDALPPDVAPPGKRG